MPTVYISALQFLKTFWVTLCNTHQHIFLAHSSLKNAMLITYAISDIYFSFKIFFLSDRMCQPTIFNNIRNIYCENTSPGCIAKYKRIYHCAGVKMHMHVLTPPTCQLLTSILRFPPPTKCPVKIKPERSNAKIHQDMGALSKSRKNVR